jgi:hypothetical protein
MKKRRAQPPISQAILPTRLVLDLAAATLLPSLARGLNPSRNLRRQRELAPTGWKIEHADTETTLALRLTKRCRVSITENFDQIVATNQWTKERRQLGGQLVAARSHHFVYTWLVHDVLRFFSVLRRVARTNPSFTHLAKMVFSVH